MKHTYIALYRTTESKKVKRNFVIFTVAYDSNNYAKKRAVTIIKRTVPEATEDNILMIMPLTNDVIITASDDVE
jgi:hypothetical protein